MAQLSAWIGAGVLAAGMSAAVVAGADVASADTGSESSSAGASTSKADRSAPSGTDADAGDSSSDGPASSSDDDAADDTSDADDAVETNDDEGADDSVDADEVDADEVEAEAGEVTIEAEPTRAKWVKPTVESEPVAESVTTEVAARPEPAQQAAAPTPSNAFQSLVLDLIGVAVKLVAGPPVVLRGSDVTVRTSRLEITEGRNIAAHWYYPDGDEPPQRLIFLQHGYLGVSAMYSRTASYLAERTNSIVVVPTHSSNRYVRDGFWLGDDQVHRATADLFLGNRDALTASALSAGFARRYGAGVALPDKFVLVGHSLGAGVAAGAAGYYADAVTASGATNHLAGVVFLDGAPPQTSLPDALDKLDGLDGYTPVLELGAPKPTRNVDAALNAHRPGHFNGLILTDGQHLDAMQGGSKLIELVSYLYQGFPTEQNKSAAQTIIAGWINDIFAGRIDESTGKCETGGCTGLYGDFGATLPIETPEGPRSAAVIGVPASPTITEFRPVAATSTSRGGKRLLLGL